MEYVCPPSHQLENCKVPLVGKPAPYFQCTAVVDGQFQEISLTDYKGKYLVLLFYPLNFNFVCPTEIVAFSDQVDEFAKYNCYIVACSTDHHFGHLLWTGIPRRQGGLGDVRFPLMSDKSLSIARAYGVLNEPEGVCYRALFILDENSLVRQVTINDPAVGRSVTEALRLVQAFRFTDERGEVCPAGWKPGMIGITQNKEGCRDYFKTR